MLCVPNLFAYGSTSVRTAKITGFSGSVSIMKSGSEKAFSPEKGMKLTHGDRIITGKDSWVKLDVDGDKELKVGEKTYISLEELTYEDGGEKTSIRLFNGDLWTNIEQKLGKDDEFEVKTPNAIMGARGTKFLVSYDEMPADGTEREGNKSTLTVLEGVVQAVATATVKVKDENGNIIEKKLTIAVSVEAGEDVELVLAKIEAELQNIADEIQEKDQEGEISLEDIQNAVTSRISQEDMDSMNVEEIDFDKLDSFSLSTILEELETEEKTDEVVDLIEHLKQLYQTTSEEEQKEEEKQETLIESISDSTKIIYEKSTSSGTSGSSSGTTNTVYPTSITFSSEQQNIILLRENTIQLSPIILPVDATNQTLTWETSNSQIVSVSGGAITGVGLGYATISAISANGLVTGTTNVVVYNDSFTMEMTTGKTMDTDYNGFVDRIAMTFSDTIKKDSIDVSSLSINPNVELYFGQISSSAIDTEAGNILNLEMTEDNEGTPIGYNSGIYGMVLGDEGVVHSLKYASAQIGEKSITDGAPPVLIAWILNFGAAEKSVELVFSEEFCTSAAIDTSKIYITDQSGNTAIPIGNSVTSSRTDEGDGSFIVDIVFDSSETPESILALEPTDGKYYIKMDSGAVMDGNYNSAVLYQNQSLQLCKAHTVDTTPPVVTGVTDEGNGFTDIAFSEFMDSSTISVTPSGTVSIAGISLIAGNKTAHVEMVNLNSGDTITIEGKDISGNSLSQVVYSYDGLCWNH